MDETRTALLWLALAVLSGVLAMTGLVSGGTPLAAMLICGIALGCAAHRPSRDRVVGAILRAFSRSMLRSVLIVVGAVMLIQLLPMEMALLLAGDVLTYVEALAAISLIAANARLRPWTALVTQRLTALRLPVVGRPRSDPRSSRLTRPARRTPPSAEDREPGWAFA